jgi:hypothetical protein
MPDRKDNWVIVITGICPLPTRGVEPSFAPSAGSGDIIEVMRSAISPIDAHEPEADFRRTRRNRGVSLSGKHLSCVSHSSTLNARPSDRYQLGAPSATAAGSPIE